MTPHEQQLVDALRAEITTSRLARIPLDTLTGAAHRADPTLLGHPDARSRIRTAIDLLTEAGVINVPKGAAQWDTRAQPPMPSWVHRTSQPRTQPTPAAQRVWSSRIAPYAARATAAQIDVLTRIEDWRSANPIPDPAPYAERSVEVFGDEKRVNDLLGWRLFHGDLPHLLTMYPVPLPLATIHVPGTGDSGMLIAENVATWHSAITALRTHPQHHRPNLHIGWGDGTKIEHSIGSASLLDPRPTAIYYFGDLDVAGLRIAAAADRAARTAGLPPVQPAFALYEEMLTSTVRRPDLSARGTPDLDQLCAWLPPPLQDGAQRILADCQRIPQEVVGVTAMRHLITTVTAIEPEQ